MAKPSRPTDDMLAASLMEGRKSKKEPQPSHLQAGKLERQTLPCLG